MTLIIDKIIVEGELTLQGDLNKRLIVLDFSLNGIYFHSGTSYASIPLQVLVPNKALILPSANSIQARWDLSYLAEGVSSMDVDLFCYTDGISVVNSEENCPNNAPNWTAHKRTDWFDITEEKAYRIRTKRVGGTGSNDVNIEGASLVIKYEKL
jgi:hypothetical protein